MGWTAFFVGLSLPIPALWSISLSFMAIFSEPTASSNVYFTEFTVFYMKQFLLIQGIWKEIFLKMNSGLQAKWLTDRVTQSKSNVMQLNFIWKMGY